MPRPVICAADGCANRITQPDGPGRPRKYCSDTCRRRKPAKKALNGPLPTSPEDSADGRGSARGGQRYTQFVNEDGPNLVDRLGIDRVAALYDVSESTVTRWILQARKDIHDAAETARWTLPAKAARLLEPTGEAFCTFREQMFTSLNGPFVTAEFHREWADKTIGAVEDGRLQAILSPPRHGKTEMMIHLATWLIIRQPNIRILWIGRTNDLAAAMCRAVMIQLEDNPKLRDTFLPPGGTFVPPARSHLPWATGEFTVATRTIIDKSPTMKAIGAGATLLSRDADVLIADDLEDQRNTVTPGQRESTKNWFFTDVASRKEPHTAMLYIGSRQHPDDLSAALDANPQWSVAAYSAHDPTCTGSWEPADTADTPAHPDQHTRCTLWPDRRDFRWLFAKRDEVADLTTFEMQYLQRLRPDGTVTFARDLVESACDPTRRAGSRSPTDLLIASVDPGGGSGHQAAVLLAVDLEAGTQQVVDAEEAKGGGPDHLASLIERWHTHHQVYTWVVEMNIARQWFTDDSRLAWTVRQCSAHVLPHHTGSNKHDPETGVAQLSVLLDNRQLTIPWADGPTRDTMRPLVEQLCNYTAGRHDSRAQRDRTDLVMALWFPQSRIAAMRRDTLQPWAEVDSALTTWDAGWTTVAY